MSSEAEFLSTIFTPVDYDLKITIENNLFSMLSLSELAHLCNMSLPTFNRKFKAIYRESPRKYITDKKLSKAKNLLVNTSLSIGEIAYQCGFDSVSTFNRVFKTAFKKNPTSYRLIQNKQDLT